ncbi:MAG: hypothetical protein ACSLEG_00920 [Candidatus Carsonella ruddii]
MKKNYNKFKNLKKILNNNYIIISVSLLKIKISYINLILKKIKFKIIFINKKILMFFNIKNYNFLNFIIIKNNFLLIKQIVLVLNKINIKPLFYITKNCIINNIPIEISKLSKENLILKFNNFLKSKFLKLIKTLKMYGKHINK